MKKFLLPTALVLLVSLPACRKLESTDADAGESAPHSSRAEDAKPEAISVTVLYPSSAAAGVPFQVLKDGASSIGVAGAGFSRTCVVYFDEHPLKTNYQSPVALDAAISNDLIAKEGRIQVTVRDSSPAARRSEPLPFEVVAPRPAGVAPRLLVLYPSSVKAGAAGATALPDKTWTIGLAGSGFGPKTTVLFGGRPVRTLYQGPGAMVAYVPVDLLATARKVSITLEDPDAQPEKPGGLTFEIR